MIRGSRRGTKKVIHKTARSDFSLLFCLDSRPWIVLRSLGNTISEETNRKG